MTPKKCEQQTASSVYWPLYDIQTVNCLLKFFSTNPHNAVGASFCRPGSAVNVAWLQCETDFAKVARLRRHWNQTSPLSYYCIEAKLKPAFVFGFAAWTSAQIRESLLRLASALRRGGICRQAKGTRSGERTSSLGQYLCNGQTKRALPFVVSVLLALRIMSKLSIELPTVSAAAMGGVLAWVRASVSALALAYVSKCRRCANRCSCWTGCNTLGSVLLLQSALLLQ